MSDADTAEATTADSTEVDTDEVTVSLNDTVTGADMGQTPTTEAEDADEDQGDAEGDTFPRS